MNLITQYGFYVFVLVFRLGLVLEIWILLVCHMPLYLASVVLHPLCLGALERCCLCNVASHTLRDN